MNPVWNYRFPDINITTLNTTIDFLIVDDDEGQDNDILGRLSVRLDAIKDGNHEFTVEKLELHHPTTQRIIQGITETFLGNRGDFTLSINIQIARKVFLPDRFLTLKCACVSATASEIAKPALEFVRTTDWEAIFLAQRQIIVEYYLAVQGRCSSEKAMKQLEREIEDMVLEMKEFVHPRKDFHERMIFRDQPIIQNSTKIVLEKALTYVQHAPIEETSMQLNLNEQETSFYVIKFPHRHMMLYWFEWLTSAWRYWSDNKGKWLYPSLLEGVFKVKSHVEPAEHDLTLNLDISSRFFLKIGSRNVSIEQLSSILLSADSVLPGALVAEVQVLENNSASYNCCKLQNQQRSYETDLDDETVAFFDFNEDDPVNSVTISAYDKKKLIGIGELNLVEVYQSAIQLGAGSLLPESRVSKSVSVNRSLDYCVKDLIVTFRDSKPRPNSLQVSYSFLDSAGQVIGSAMDVVKVILTKASSTENRYVTTVSPTTISASNSLNAQFMKIDVSEVSAFGSVTCIGSFKISLAQATEVPVAITDELSSGVKTQFTFNKRFRLLPLNVQEVETVTQFRVSHELNNLWYGELGNLNSKPKVVHVYFDRHQLTLYGYFEDDSDDLQVLHSIPWSKVTNVTVLTSSVLSVQYQDGAIPKQLFIFNCPAKSLRKLSEERRQFAPFRELVKQILAFTSGEERQRQELCKLFSFVVEAFDSDLIRNNQNAVCLLRLYLYQVICSVEWEYYTATRFHELVINSINFKASLLDLSSHTFEKDDFRNITDLLNGLFHELQQLFCTAILKAIHDHLRDPTATVTHFLPPKSILQEFSRKIFDVIGVFYSYSFQFFLQSSLSSKLFATQVAWKSAMTLYKEVDKKFDILQQNYWSILSAQFQKPISLSDYLSFTFLVDNFVSSFITDMKRMVHNNIKSASEEHGTVADGLNAVKDISIPLLQALNSTYDSMTKFHTLDFELQLDGLNLYSIEDDVFPTDEITNLSGLMYLDTVLSFGRRIADELLPASDEWLVSGVDNQIGTKWKRCIDYAMQICELAHTLQHGRKHVLEDAVFEEKEQYQQLLQSVFQDIILKVLDQLSCGLFLSLHHHNCLQKGFMDVLQLPTSLFFSITELLSHVEMAVTSKQDDRLWRSISSLLQDTVIAKCLTYYFAVFTLAFTDASINSLDLKTISLFGDFTERLHLEIKQYLLKQHRRDANDFDNLLSNSFPQSRLALLALSTINNFITGDASGLNDLMQQLILQSQQENGIEFAKLRVAVLHFVQLCLFLRKFYFKSINISELDLLMQDCEMRLSAIREEAGGRAPIGRFNPMVSVFTQMQPARRPSQNEANPGLLYSPRLLPKLSFTFDDILAHFLLFTALPKEEKVQRIQESGSTRRPSLNNLTSNIPRSDQYSLLSAIHSLYSEDDRRSLSKKIHQLKKMEIPLYSHEDMNTQKAIPSAVDGKPPHFLFIPEIQLMDMFYLTAQTKFHLYFVLQIGSWICGTRRVRGNVFNNNLLSKPIQIPIYHPLRPPSSSMKNARAVQNRYLSEEITAYIMYSTSSTDSATVNVNDTVIGCFTIPFFHYHHFDSSKTPGKVLLNSEDSQVNQAILSANLEKRNLPSINYTLQLL